MPYCCKKALVSWCILLLLLLFLYLFVKFIITMFFDLIYFSWLSKAVLTKTSKCQWKQGIEKNNNSNDINTLRNDTFVNFKNCTNLKTSKRIGLLTITVHSSMLGLKNPKLTEQLFSGKKSSDTHEIPFNFKNCSGKSDEFFRSD